MSAARRTGLATLAAATGLLAIACSGTSQTPPVALPPDVVDDGDTVQLLDADEDDAQPDGTPPAPSVCASDQVMLTFTVDDTANATYVSGELLWTGSFVHDATSNELTYASSWLPTEGPYPALYDDGPAADGGHEAPGAVAGDHIFSTAVCYLADEDKLIAYGVLNGDLRWIWVGANGQLEIAAGTTGVVEVPGLVIGAHGAMDFRVLFDAGAVHPDFAPLDLTNDYRLYLKGTMNSWTPVQLLDDGYNGDAQAGDGIYTYEHGRLLGPHDGLLPYAGQAQFVFVFARTDDPPDDGLEYKDDNQDAAPEGVSAQIDCGEATWQSGTVTLELDSKGKSYNTTITAVCAGGPPTPECDEDEPGTPCPAGQQCVDGVCVASDECGPQAPCTSPDQECVNGACVAAAECGPTIPCAEPGTECVDGACITVAAECDDMTPCSDVEASCVDGVCVAPDCSDTNPCLLPTDECLEGICTPIAGLGPAPDLLLVVPPTGSSSGGTLVTLTGQDFAPEATVTFGGEPATVETSSPTELTITTGAHALGSVDVRVTNPDGQFSVYVGGYTFVETAAAPVISDVLPSSGPSDGGTQIVISGANFDAGATVLLGTATATEVSVAPGGTSIMASTPPLPLGAVDVKVLNGDGQQAVLAGGFTYVSNTADWATLETNMALAAFEGGLSTPVHLRVYEEGVTEAVGAGFSLTAEIGVGPLASDPESDAGWTWTNAPFLEDQANDDIFAAGVGAPLGSWSVAGRVTNNGGDSWLYVDTDGTDNGLALGALPSLTVAAAPAVFVASLDPPSLSVFGGDVTVHGAGFHAACSIAIDGVPVDPADWTLVDDTEIILSTPRHAAGSAPLAITCPDGFIETMLPYVAAWDGDLAEWPLDALLADGAAATNWGAGSNELTSLHAAVVGDQLIVGVIGAAVGDFGANAISVWLDTDIGGSTGLTDATALEDVGLVDACLGGAMTFSAAGFGAEFAWASLDMASYDPATDAPAAVPAGWRGLADPADLAWLIDGGVYASASGIEAVISLSDLYGPATGTPRLVGLVARIGNADGTATSNQALPPGTSGAGDENATGSATLAFTW